MIKKIDGRKLKKTRCACGGELAEPAITRQRKRVCEKCAEKIPRQFGGRRPALKCNGCQDTFSRPQLKMKNYKLYCKKCLKEKFSIDFW